MKIIFLVPLSLSFPMALLLVTGHAGITEKLTIMTFLWLMLATIWSLLRGGREGKGE